MRRFFYRIVFLPDRIMSLVLICKQLLRHVSCWHLLTHQSSFCSLRSLFHCCFQDQKTTHWQVLESSSRAAWRAAWNHSTPLMWSSDLVNQKQQCPSLRKNNAEGPRSITELLISANFNMNRFALRNYFAKGGTRVRAIQTPRSARVELKQGPHQRPNRIRKDRGPGEKPNGPEMIAHNSSKWQV